MAACCGSAVIDHFTARCYSDIFCVVEEHLFFYGFLSACPVNLFCWFYMIIRDEGYTNVFIVGFRATRHSYQFGERFLFVLPITTSLYRLVIIGFQAQGP